MEAHNTRAVTGTFMREEQTAADFVDPSCIVSGLQCGTSADANPARQSQSALASLGCGMKFELTKHAQRALAEREIPIEWVERTLEAPELTLPDPNDATVQRCFRRIPEFGGRVLRVTMNRQLNRSEW